MSAGKRGARAGAAAFALGLALAATPAAGVAVAAPSEDDASSVATPEVAAGAATGQVGRTPRGASRRAVPAPADSATAVGTGAPRMRLGATAAIRGSRLEPKQSGTGSVPSQPAAAASPVVIVAGASTGSGTVPPAFISPVKVATPPAAATAISIGPRARAAGASRAAGVRAQIVAYPTVTVGALVTGFLDSASNWFSGLPANPVTQLLQGALLLVRRTLMDLFPALNQGQTTGQTAGTADAAYFTDQELRDYLLELAKKQYGSLFGQTVAVYGNGGPWVYDYLKVDSSVAGSGATSGTNTQVDGVDEADFVETDGRFLYVAHNGQLSIVGTDLTVASQSSLSGNVVGEFLAGDRLTVITQSGYDWYGPMVKMACGPWWPTNPQTTVTVYDVTDRTAPAIVTQTMLDGGFQDARAVDGVVYVVLQRGLNLPAPQYTDTPVDSGVVAPVDGPIGIELKPARWGWDPTVTANRTYETWDEYAARVGDQIVDLALPHAYSVDAEGNSVDLGVVVGAEDIVRPHAGDPQSLLTLVSVDSGSTSPGLAVADSVGTLVAGGGNTIYMNHEAMYVGTTEYQYSDSGSSNDTRIDRFTIEGTNVAWQATGVVSGTLINQFAMDEQGGYLHVATHTTESHYVNDTWSNRNDNGVYVLDTVGDTLDVTGSLTGLAPGEQLYAARFVGDKAYVVTFVQTDPLFAIDLSDPAAPILQGELVIPGFSNYLQSVGDGLLVGIGQEREAGTWNTHVHATLFDVTDGANPTQITRQYLTDNTQWSWSDAQFDHHALLYSAEDGLLVVPVYGSGYDADTGTYRSEQLLKVMRVTAGGIEVLGDIHTDQSVFRTVRVGDVLYAVSDSAVTAYSLSDLSQIGSNAAPAEV